MKNKTTATLLAFFLGGFGIHQFYLKKNLKGVIYFLFFWTWIPAIIGFIDFIILLAMNQEKFDLKYNNGETSNTSFNFGKRKQIINGLETFLNEYPNVTENSLKFTKDVLPTLNPKPELIGEKIQNFMYEQISISGLDEKNEIKDYIKTGLNFLPDNFDKSFNQIYFSTIVDEYLSDEALDPDEVNSLVNKANELGIEKYQNEDAIRQDYSYYIKNWEFDNGVFPQLQSDFIMNKNESCIYKVSNIELLEQKEVTNRINYAGPRARIKIAKGLSYNLGSYGYSTNKETRRISKGIGVLNVTTKRILFKASQKNTTIRLSAIVDLEPFSDGLKIYKSTGNPLIIKDNNGAELYQAVNGAIRNLNR